MYLLFSIELRKSDEEIFKEVAALFDQASDPLELSYALVFELYKAKCAKLYEFRVALENLNRHPLDARNKNNKNTKQ